MAANLDTRATHDLAAAYVDPAKARKFGFRDGFIGEAARSFSDFADQHSAYFEGFRDGRQHREEVESVCRREGIEIDDLMRKAFTFYHEAKYGGREKSGTDAELSR